MGSHHSEKQELETGLNSDFASSTEPSDFSAAYSSSPVSLFTLLFVVVVCLTSVFVALCLLACLYMFVLGFVIHFRNISWYSISETREGYWFLLHDIITRIIMLWFMHPALILERALYRVWSTHTVQPLLLAIKFCFQNLCMFSMNICLTFRGNEKHSLPYIHITYIPIIESTVYLCLIVNSFLGNL